MQLAFSNFKPAWARQGDGLLASLDGSSLRAVEASVILPENQTHFGYVHRGLITFIWEEVAFYLPQGFYFAIPGYVNLQPQRGALAIVISRHDSAGFFHIGKIEHRGRLRYINGCTDSLLVPPVIRGDACLNLLYFPPGIDQTMHTHPSDRIGLILSGSGVCITEDEGGASAIPLEAGMFFVIHAEGKHKFRTTDQEMRVLAYHPDSDFGPTHEDHPMINRTMVDGVSARELADIHT